MTVTFIKGLGQQPQSGTQGSASATSPAAASSNTSSLSASLQVSRSDAAITSFRSQGSGPIDKIRNPDEARRVADQLKKDIVENRDQGLSAQGGRPSLSALRNVFA